MTRSHEQCKSLPPAASRPRVPDERGFTLLEALIAAIVLTVGLVALAELLAVSLRMHMLGRETTTATRLAQDKFEELMKMNFSTSPAIAVSPTNTLDSDVAPWVDTPPGLPNYKRRWQVASGPAPNLRTVTVRVIPQLNDRRASDEVTITTVLRSW